MISPFLATVLVPLAGSPATPPAAPIAVSTGPTGSTRALLTWLPGEVRCDGAIVVPEVPHQPLLSLTWASSAAGMSPVSYAFNIDPHGRTTGIRRLEKTSRPDGSDDIAPSLAASRFAPGNKRLQCVVAYVPRQASLTEAPMPDLLAYAINPISGPLPKEGWQRVFGAGNCRGEGAPALQSRVFPDFSLLTATPGAREWSVVGYDVDANGVPANIRIITGTGNRALDLASRQAVEKTRYYAGRRTGCHYPYWRSAATLPAPPAPAEREYRPAGATCPDQRAWAVQSQLRFPEAYRRRAIEGWAIVTYDVAPWGEVSNIKVAANEPAEDFGTQAIAVVRSAKVATTQGFVGCVDRVKFVMDRQQPDTGG